MTYEYPGSGKLDPFTLGMMRDVLKDHSALKKNEHGSGYCCQVAASYLRKVGDHEKVVAGHKAAEQAGEPVFNPLSERQGNYIRSLARRTPLHLLAPKTRSWVELVQAQNEISKADARLAIDEMLSVQQTPIPTDDQARATRLISPPQLGFLKKLLAEKQHDLELDLANLADLPFSVASKHITELKGAPFKGESKTGKDAPVLVQEGAYQVGDDVYKVKKAIHGSGNLYASKWLPEDKKWTYVGQRVFSLLTAETKMTAEQAKAWGKLYGRCVRCHLPLTDEISQAHGYGKKCAEHEGWLYDTKIDLGIG